MRVRAEAGVGNEELRRGGLVPQRRAVGTDVGNGECIWGMKGVRGRERGSAPDAGEDREGEETEGGGGGGRGGGRGGARLQSLYQPRRHHKSEMRDVSPCSPGPTWIRATAHIRELLGNQPQFLPEPGIK